MEHKNLIAAIYLKNGVAVEGFEGKACVVNVDELVRSYNDSGIDKLLIFDLSRNDAEHEQNIRTIKDLNRNIEIPVCAGGNVNRLEDIKKLLYAGCKQVMLNSAKADVTHLVEEGCRRFGRDKLALTLTNVDILFKHRESIEGNISEIIVLNEDIVGTVGNVTDIPRTLMQNTFNLERWVTLLRSDTVHGIFGKYLNDTETDIMDLKHQLAVHGIETKKLQTSMDFDCFKLNEDGLIPVIVQDYQTLDVLMLAYMDREAFQRTLSSGKMTYYSRSRKKQWVKGETSGHYQYVKSLALDCDNDTILAKVSQVGAACHTGAPSCFFNELVKKEYIEKNPLKVFESVYSVISDRKLRPKEGSYTNYLFDKGIDKILKKVGEEATEIVIAAKNPDAEEIKYEISDFLYHIMVLMVEKGVTWEDIAQELAQR